MAQNPEMVARLAKASPEGKKVVKYFMASGCMSGKMKDAEYDKMLADKLAALNVRQRALDKIGLDEDELKEIPPVNFQGFEFGGNVLSGKGDDGKTRSSKYSCTWLFFSDTQVYMYHIVFDMETESKNERTEEYFYKDITNFSTASESIQLNGVTSSGCGKKNVSATFETSSFSLIVPGDKFFCSTSSSENVDQTISAMKAKLREKKNS